jgi:SAM-dependent methyltransferase
VLTPASEAKDERGAVYPRQRCSSCGTEFLEPPPSAEALARAYGAAYYGAGQTKFGGPVERFRDAAFSTRARRFRRGLPAVGAVLDLGCGDGRLLRQLWRSAPNLELHGLEMPGPAATRAATVPGVSLHLGGVESARFPEHAFDLVTLVHVIEHLPTPAALLRRVVSWIRPGGRLFVAYPNPTSWQARLFGPAWFHLDPPRHLSLVPPETLIASMEREGLRLERRSDLCLEQNLYGWLQSALNAIDGDRNLLYERLKRNRTFRPERRLAPLAHALIAGALVVPALVADMVAALARRGATVELTFRKP